MKYAGYEYTREVGTYVLTYVLYRHRATEHLDSE